MFSTIYTKTWQEISELSQRKGLRETPSFVGTMPFDPSLYQLLWSQEFGAGREMDNKLLAQSERVKAEIFKNRLFAIVPLYITSICMEQCVYCNFRAGNKGTDIDRVRLTDHEIEKEVRFLIEEKGLRVIELVYATDPLVRVDSMCRHTELVQRILHEYGGGVVGINAEALGESEYRSLLSAGLSFVVLWQETYDREKYVKLHPGLTKKTHFEYRIDAYERMISAGIKHIGMGVLSGLSDWRIDWAVLMCHEAYIFRTYGQSAAILGIPRLKPASGAVLKSTPHIPSRQEFQTLVALHNLFSPETLAFVSTREDWELCLNLSKGGGCLFTFNCSTIPGGYSLGHRGNQFPTNSFDVQESVDKLEQSGLYPEFDLDFSSITCDKVIV